MSAFLHCCCIESILGVFFLLFIGLLLQTGSHSIHTSRATDAWLSGPLTFYIAAALNLGIFILCLQKIKTNEAKQQREQDILRQRLVSGDRLRIASNGSVGPNPLNTSGTVL